jgi:hypothetical protein
MVKDVSRGTTLLLDRSKHSGVLLHSIVSRDNSVLFKKLQESFTIIHSFIMRAGGVAQVVDHLPSNHMVLSSSPRTGKRNL